MQAFPGRLITAATLLVAGIGFALSATQQHRPGDSPGLGELVITPPEATIDASTPDGAPSASRVVFALENRGRAALRIVAIDAKCGCTVVENPASPLLEPGESTSLIVNATPPQFGNKRTYMSVYTDVPGQSELRIPFTLRGTEVVAPYVLSAPAEVRLRATHPSEALSRGCEVRTVERRRSKPWLNREQLATREIRVFWTERPVELAYTEDEVIRVYQLLVETTAPIAENTPVRAFLDLTGLCPATRTYAAVPVVAELVAPIQVQPRELFLTVPSSGGKPPVERVLVFLEAERFEGLRISVDGARPAWIEAAEPQYVPAPAAISAKLRLRFSAPRGIETDGQPLLRANIHIRTNDPRQPSIELPVTVRFE